MSLMMSGDTSVTAFPDGDNLFEWIGTIEGVEGTVYNKLNYRLSISFGSDYPFTAPTIKFVTP
jgi:ubiquitin-conjugating enzyme E2 C